MELSKRAMDGSKGRPSQCSRQYPKILEELNFDPLGDVGSSEGDAKEWVENIYVEI